jgi:hypothetical protein
MIVVSWHHIAGKGSFVSLFFVIFSCVCQTGIVMSRILVGGVRRGFVLPLTVLLTLMLLTGFGYWYRQVIWQSYLGERLVLQRLWYLECQSLLPMLKVQLDRLAVEELQQPVDRFVRLESSQRLRWEIDRGAWYQQQVPFVFHRMDRPDRPSLVLTVPYSRESDEIMQ